MKPIDFSLSVRQINEQNFDEIALATFQHQYKNNHLYQTYANLIGRSSDEVKSIDGIPFLPIRFFKEHNVISGSWQPETIFTSSATTGSTVSRHSVPVLRHYLDHATRVFEYFYGPISGYHFLALLPSYLERSGSSLIAMMDHFIRQDDSGLSGFFLRDDKALLKRLECARQASKKVILWGVSFALLDLAERHSLDLSACIVMETGGMKGRRKEWVRSELHSYLQQRLNVSSIHSEYGMTELMSQAYSTRDGLYQCPPSMRVLVRDINDPFSGVVGGRAGVIQIIDLANANTCSFIETEDLGRLSEVSGFEILGRLDNSDVRGCNLMIT